MKFLTLTIALLMTGFGSMAQDTSNANTPAAKPVQTLLNNNSNVGLVVGFTNGFSIIDNKDAFVGGMNLGLILDHSLTIGIAGRGFGCSSSFNNIVPGKEAFLGGGYGGLFIEPILTPTEVFHLTFPCLLGAGGAAYVEHQDWNYNDDGWDNHDHHNVTLDSDGFFVLEPGVQVEMNVVRWFRIGIGASYRWVYGLDLKKTDADMLDGFTTGMTFKFGKF